MNDGAGKTSLSLAIAEKKPQKPGGCIGIFFQLFDWNRRFPKKRLFSKKLLPPARAKQPSKKFRGDEKFPKHRLIADENGGGFPNPKKNGTRSIASEAKHKMQTPSLVARLMGLESMPAAQQDNVKKLISSEIGREREEKFVAFKGEQVNLKNGTVRHDLRPQKLQKTGPCERLPVTRFGSEALQLKNVLSRSRKHHPKGPKLASPVKSPRSFSGRNASRWISAASKLLEPGLQARNRAKHALTYHNAIHHGSKGVVLLEGEKVLTAEQSATSHYFASAAKSLNGQSSCRNCGHLVDVVDSRSNGKEGMPLCSSLLESKGNLPNHLELSASNAARAIEKTRNVSASILHREPLDEDGQVQWLLTTEICKPRQDISSANPSKNRTQKHGQVPFDRDRVPPRSKLSNFQSHRLLFAANTTIDEAKDFIALNRNLNGHSRSRIPANVESSRFDADRKYCFGQDNSSAVRKRRTMSSNRQNENSDLSRSSVGKQTNAMMEKSIKRNAHSANYSCIQSRVPYPGERRKTSSSSHKDDGVISFSFSSPMQQKIGVPADLQKRRGQKNLGNYCTALQSSRVDEINGKECLQNPLSLSGDTLGALLEQKLKELTSQEDDDLAPGGAAPKRTTAMILQEIITALTAERPFPLDNVAVGSNTRNISSQNGHISDPNIFQTKTKKREALARHGPENDNPSPGSVLEVSFSHDSCFSGSFGNSSGIKHHADSMNWSYDELNLLKPDTDLLDSATSLGKGQTWREFMTNSLNCFSEILYSVKFAGTELDACRLTQAKGVILNAELVCGNTFIYKSGEKGDFSVSSFILYELEALASVVWTNCGGLLGFEDTKEGNHFKNFIFDCVIEYLDMKFGECNMSEYPWARKQLCMTSELLMHDIVREVVRWTGMVGLVPEELINREMSHSLGKWNDFKFEVFETGVDLDSDLFQVLVDETVIELLDCRLN